MLLPVFLVSAAMSTVIQHDAHVHGHAELAVAIDESGVLQVEFRSPAYDIYGFERAPESDAETAIIAEANARFAVFGDVVSFSGGQCEIVSFQISWGAGHEDGEHDHHDGHDHHDDHDQHNEQADHGDVHVTYSGRCAQPDRINAVSTNLLDRFESLSEIDGVFLSPTRQLGLEFTQSQTSVRLP